MNTSEQIERQLFLEYTHEYNKFYTGQEDNEDYVRHLEKCLQVYTALQPNTSEEKINTLYTAEDVDFETTLETIQALKTVFSNTPETPNSTLSPDQPSI